MTSKQAFTYQLTDAQTAEMRRLRSYFPYRIVYGAWNSQKREWFASAVDSMRIPNKMQREGWTVFILEVQHGDAG